jgi:hypothetical protein
MAGADSVGRYHLTTAGYYRIASDTDALDFLLANGVTSDRVIPYRGEKQPCLEGTIAPYRALAWGFVGAADPGSRAGPTHSPTDAAIKAALCEFGPVVSAVTVTEGFIEYGQRDGVYHEHVGTEPINHAVVIVGWDDTKDWVARDGSRHRGAWIIKNGWGIGWGHDGYMDLAYGSNRIGSYATWVRAASVAFQPDLARFRALVPDARPFEPITSEFSPAPKEAPVAAERRRRVEALRRELAVALRPVQLSESVTRRVETLVGFAPFQQRLSYETRLASAASFMDPVASLTTRVDALSAHDPSSLRARIEATIPVQGYVSQTVGSDAPIQRFDLSATALIEVEVDLFWTGMKDPSRPSYLSKVTGMKTSARDIRYTPWQNAMPAETADLLKRWASRWLDAEPNKLNEAISSALDRVFRDPLLKVPPLGLVE